MPVGHWKRGDSHPTLNEKVFSCYVKSNGSMYEYWVSPDKLESIRAKGRRGGELGCVPTQTGTPKGTFSMGDKHPSLDRIFYSHTNGKEVWLKPDTYYKTLSSLAVISRQRKRKIRIEGQHCTMVEWIYRFRDMKNAAHGRVVYHVDHIIPLSRGGVHRIENLQLSTAEFNLKKGAK